MTIKIPDLTKFKPNSPVLMPMLAAGEKPDDHVFTAMMINFMRIVDITITDYVSMRNNLNNYWNREDSSTVPLNYLPIAAGHFEACISNMSRAIVHLKKLRGFSAIPGCTKNLLRVKYNILTGSVEGSISEMRHAVQHLEKRISKGEIRKGEAIYPSSAEKDGMKIGNQKIKFDELAQWIQELHGLCEKLVIDWRKNYSAK